MLKRICVFCGSSPGLLPAYAEAARDLGFLLAEKGIGLVYGGGNVGMMGIIASAVLEKNGDVIGVIPRDLADKEVAYTELSDLRIVGSMHERKALMADLADGFIAMPGGLGTIEEFFEVLTWAQLGIHPKPCGLLNVAGYFDKLMEFLDHVVDQQFVIRDHLSIVLLEESAEALIKTFETYRPPVVDKAAWALRLAEGETIL